MTWAVIDNVFDTVVRTFPSQGSADGLCYSMNLLEGPGGRYGVRRLADHTLRIGVIEDNGVVTWDLECKHPPAPDGTPCNLAEWWENVGSELIGPQYDLRPYEIDVDVEWSDDGPIIIPRGKDQP